MNTKKIVAVILTVCLVIGVAAGGIYLFRQHQANSNLVEVFPVSSLTIDYWDDSIQSYGTVSTNLNQEIYYNESDVIQDVLVEQGQEVEAGTPLIQYDTTLKQLESEKAEAELALQRTYRESLTAFITQLKNTKPVSSSDITPNSLAASLLTAGQTAATASFISSSYIHASSSLPESSGESSTPESTTPEPTTEEPTTEAPTTVQPTTVPTTEVPTTTPSVQTPITLLSSLSEEDEPAGGSGTEDDPYLYYITPDASISSGYYYYLIMSQETAIVEIRSLKSTSTALADATLENTNLVYSLTFNGGEVSSSIFPDADNNDGDYNDGNADFDYDPGSFPTDVSGYTKEELAKELASREEELSNLDITIRKAELALEKLNKELESGTAVSTVNGIVKTLNTVEDVKLSGDPLLVVTGEEGFYINATISEFYLETVKVGQTVGLTSFESGISYDGTISSISDTPQEGTYYPNTESENPNSSAYDCIIKITGNATLKNGEFLGITYQSTGEGEVVSSGILLESIYISEEDDGNYIYKVGEDGLLLKQKVTIGRIISGGYYMEILDGLSTDDYISYPFGKNVKEGAKVSGMNENALSDPAYDLQDYDPDAEYGLDDSDMEDADIIDESLLGSPEDNSDMLPGVDDLETGNDQSETDMDTGSDAAEETSEQSSSGSALNPLKDLYCSLLLPNQIKKQEGGSIC